MPPMHTHAQTDRQGHILSDGSLLYYNQSHPIQQPDPLDSLGVSRVFSKVLLYNQTLHFPTQTCTWHLPPKHTAESHTGNVSVILSDDIAKTRQQHSAAYASWPHWIRWVCTLWGGIERNLIHSNIIHTHIVPSRQLIQTVSYMAIHYGH